MAESTVFVSHSHEDSNFTARLVKDLKAAGATVWVDSTSIQHGSFAKHISEGLDNSEWLLLVLTPAAITSNWVLDEAYTALTLVSSGRMKGIIPILARPCEEKAIPPLLAGLHRYDATRDYEQARGGILNAIGLVDKPKYPFVPSANVVIDLIPESHHLDNLGFKLYQTRSEDSSYLVEWMVQPLCDVCAGPSQMGEEKRLVDCALFQISRCQVTVAEYACFVHAGQEEPPDWLLQLQHPEHPVVNVSWMDACEYAAWLSERMRWPWRLPTVEEWEKAACGGIHGHMYPWGETFDQSRCNTKESSRGSITPVGSYLSGASPYGTLDQAGNVWEWTGSAFESSTDSHTVYGGSCNSPAIEAVVTSRKFVEANYTADDLGFRLVVAVNPGY